jgi:hypothetical protein
MGLMFIFVCLASLGAFKTTLLVLSMPLPHIISEQSTVKSMFIIFFDIMGTVHKEFVLVGHTVH